MADESLLALSNNLIAGRYAVDTTQVLPEAGGGLPAYLARDRMASDAKRVALAVSRDASPRLRHMQSLDESIDYLMMPLGHGIAPISGGKGEGYFVVCMPPSGAPVSADSNPWPEKALIDLVLRPVAAVLDILQARKLTYRAIRPNNVFQSAPGQPVSLGAAWAAPPAMHYVAMCLPACRGDGTIADDVYALGVLLLTLSGGRLPMANMDDTTVIRWKLDLGSFAALTRDIPLPGSLAELLRAMLAEDPDHRPLPGALMEHTSTRGRRLAARPARRSQNPLMLNDIAVFDARTLAYALFSDQKKAIQFLRNGLVTQWLRRGLGDASLATQIEDLVRGRMADAKSGSWSDPLLVMRTISALDHRMPLCWRGMALWPDALPSILAEGYASKPELLAAAEELLLSDILGWWSADLGHSETPGAADRQLLQSGGPGGLLRLFYGLNPLLPCRVPAMAKRWLVAMPGLMQFLEDTAEGAGESLIDLPISVFIAARADRTIEVQVNGLATAKSAEAFRRSELILLCDLQSRYHPAPMPRVAKWMAARLQPGVQRWRNRPRREAAQARLETLSQAGILSRLLDLVEDPAAWAQDTAGAQLAAKEMAMIDAELTAIDNGDKARFADAERFGRAIAGGIGLSAFILMVMSALLR